MKNVVVMVGVVVLLMASAACTTSNSSKAPEDGKKGQNGVVIPQFKFTVSSAGAMVYDPEIPGSSFAVLAGGTYTITVTGDYSYTAAWQKIDSVNGSAPTSMALVAGSNTITIPNDPGSLYSLSVTASDGSNSATRTFAAFLNCATPKLDANDMHKESITIASAGEDNKFNYSAAGVVDGSVQHVGTIQYAWDLTGDGSVDVAFSTSTAASNVYENYIGNRATIGLIVKDSCSMVTLNVARNIPSANLFNRHPGDLSEYIHGRVLTATGDATGYKDIWDDAKNDGKGADYWATNNQKSKPVRSLFEPNDANSTFTIQSDGFTYGLPSSVAFGEKIVISNINFVKGANLDGSDSSVDASNATMTTIAYSTEQVGDGKPQIKVGTGASCSLSLKGAEIINPHGTPCSPGTTNAKYNNNEMRWTVHVWGAYTCTGMKDANGNSVVSMSGEFDGSDDVVDACIGGGQGGQGGDLPPGV